MPRVSHVVASLKRKKRLFKKTKGFWGGRANLYRTAIETLRRGMVFSYRDRRDKKGSFRRLWIARINAACVENGITYSRFINGLKKVKIGLDRKIMSEMAISDKAGFSELVKMAKDALDSSVNVKVTKPKAVKPKTKK